MFLENSSSTDSEYLQYDDGSANWLIWGGIKTVFFQ
jgi:hypothetical protein